MVRWFGMAALACAVLGGVASCGGRSHAENADGGGAGIGGPGTAGTGAVAAGATGAGAAGTGTSGGGAGAAGGGDGGADAAQVVSCDKTMKACLADGICVPAKGCCDSTDCPAQAGKTGSCDTGTHSCSYACGTGLKSCNGTCIAADGCCVDSECSNDYACAAGTCKVTCSASSDCQSGFTCSKGACLKVMKIVGGAASSCALISDGLVRCWGGPYGSPGQIVTIANLAGATDIAEGFNHACAVVAGGNIKCWGDNGYGQFGGGTAGNFTTDAQPVTGLSGVSGIFAGGDRSCAVLSGGAMKCWGAGALGDGNTSATAPVSVLGLIGVTAVAVGSAHICAVSSGSVWCWGNNLAGQLALDPSGGPQNTSSNTPFSTGVRATSVAVGASQTDAMSDYTCAVLSAGGVECWGAYLDGTRAFSPTPTLLAGSSGATFVTAGTTRACLIGPDRTVRCWGNNYWGELGLDPKSTMTAAFPSSPVTSLGTVVSVQSGSHHACATVPDGTARCWGQNNTAQLSLTNIQVPFSFVPVVLSSW